MYKKGFHPYLGIASLIHFPARESDGYFVKMILIVMKSKINVFMKRDTEKWRIKWEKSRVKGKYRFMLYYALMFSIFGNILWAGIYMLVEGSVLNDIVIKEYGTWRIILRLLFFFAIGWPLGYRTWNKNEKRFKASGIPD
ncbi:MAG: hypothetical protein GY834_03955 [Bacteroidetes bacterium]|nr:hypothetical protein [Bacteroidota bacterium]